MVESLGHNVPRVFMSVFGVGTALAGLAGVIGGSTFVTEPAMAATVGSVIFVVVVVGGMGSLSRCFLASLIIGVVQTFAVALDYSVLILASKLRLLSWHCIARQRAAETHYFTSRTHIALLVFGLDFDFQTTWFVG
jgi:branched-subunit amino acid ABC-type transport system permease component